MRRTKKRNNPSVRMNLTLQCPAIPVVHACLLACLLPTAFVWPAARCRLHRSGFHMRAIWHYLEVFDTILGKCLPIFNATMEPSIC